MAAETQRRSQVALRPAGGQRPYNGPTPQTGGWQVRGQYRLFATRLSQGFQI